MHKSAVLVCAIFAALSYSVTAQNTLDPALLLTGKINWNCFSNLTLKTNCLCAASQDVDVNLLDQTADKFLYCAFQEINTAAYTLINKTTPFNSRLINVSALMEIFISTYNNTYHTADYSSLSPMLSNSSFLSPLNFTSYAQSLNGSLMFLASNLGIEIGPFKPNPSSLLYAGVSSDNSTACSCKTGSLVGMALSWPNMEWNDSLGLHNSTSFAALANETINTLWDVFDPASFSNKIIDFRITRFTKDKVIHAIAVFEVGTSFANLTSEFKTLLNETFPAFNLTFIQTSSPEQAANCAWNLTMAGNCSLLNVPRVTYPYYMNATYPNTTTAAYTPVPTTNATLPGMSMNIPTLETSTLAPLNKSSITSPMWPSTNSTVTSAATTFSTVSSKNLTSSSSTTILPSSSSTTPTTSPTTTLIVTNGTAGSNGGLNASSVNSTPSTSLMPNRTNTASSVNVITTVPTTASSTHPTQSDTSVGTFTTTSKVNNMTSLSSTEVTTSSAAKAALTTVNDSVTTKTIQSVSTTRAVTISSSNTTGNKTEIKNLGVILADYIYYVTIPSFIGILFLICCCLCCLQGLYVIGRRERDEEENYKK